jgi:hypothetical protein
MEFFDRKEEVLDIQLTQYGKYLLSVGKLEPVYYSFFDSDVDYDTQYQGLPPVPQNTESTAGPSENQKDTVDRIKETPRIKVVHSIDSVEKSVNQIEISYKPPVGGINLPPGLSLTGEGVFLNNPDGTLPPDPSGLVYNAINPSSIDSTLFSFNANEYVSETYGDIPYKYPVPPKQNRASLELPLGKSKYNSNYYPAFDLKLKKGELKSSINHNSTNFGIERIPQLDIDVTFETSVSSDKNEPIVTIKGSEETPFGNLSEVSADGTYVKIEEDYILIDLQELNSFNTRDNFDVEVYEIDTTDTSGIVVETTKKLKFSKTTSPLDLLSDYLSQDKTVPVELMENIVEYYFNLSVDNEISIEMDTNDNIYSKPAFANDVVDSLPNEGVEICED